MCVPDHLGLVQPPDGAAVSLSWSPRSRLVSVEKQGPGAPRYTPTPFTPLSHPSTPTADFILGTFQYLIFRVNINKIHTIDWSSLILAIDLITVIVLRVSIILYLFKMRSILYSAHSDSEHVMRKQSFTVKIWQFSSSSGFQGTKAVVLKPGAFIPQVSSVGLVRTQQSLSVPGGLCSPEQFFCSLNTCGPI